MQQYISHSRCMYFITFAISKCQQLSFIFKLTLHASLGEIWFGGMLKLGVCTCRILAALGRYALFYSWDVFTLVTK